MDGYAVDSPRRVAIRNKCVTNEPPGLCGNRSSGHMAERAGRSNFSCEVQDRTAALISKANFKTSHRVGEQVLDSRFPGLLSEVAATLLRSRAMYRSCFWR